jgi:hypothetical protein
MASPQVLAAAADIPGAGGHAFHRTFHASDLSTVANPALPG